MNKTDIGVIVAFLFIPAVLCAQDTDSLKFTVSKELPHTPVKNQHRTQTCWSFSGLSFFESEMLRMGKPEIDLSEMFVVNQCYRDKADKYVRMKGNTNFGPGGIFYDILYVTRNYGLVPEQVYRGIKNKNDIHDHTEMDNVLKKQVDGVIVNKSAVISTSWNDSLGKKVDSYLGQLPEKFQYDGKTFTPKTFVTNFCGINPDNYIQITSFTHHPFYKPFILEVPDNWIWSNFHNVPLDEMEQIIDFSLRNGYTVAWASDVTEKGFSDKKGVAVIPDEKKSPLGGTITNSDIDLSFPVAEKVITQELRQKAFDNQETTDDHGMHIIGLAQDQTGKTYYIVKNSWGIYNRYKGYFYASKAFVRYKTTGLLVNKNGIPKNIRKKLGI